MRIGEVVGTVTLSRCHPELTGSRMKLIVPLTLDNLTGRCDAIDDELVAFDEIGCGEGCRVAISEGREAAMPFYPAVKPIDAYCAAILDTVDIVIQPDEDGKMPIANE